MTSETHRRASDQRSSTQEHPHPKEEAWQDAEVQALDLGMLDLWSKKGRTGRFIRGETRLPVPARPRNITELTDH
jgi:hypothetical protein